MSKCVRRVAAALSAAGTLAAGGAAEAAPAMWAVSDADSTIYLFGTVHVIPAEADWRTPLYDKAYTEAGEIWLEANVHDAGEDLAKTMLAQGFDFEGDLEQRLGKDDFERLVAALEPAGMPPAAVRMMRPWLAGVMLLGASMQGTTLQAETGAEATSTASAKRDGKGLRYFETVEQQIGFFSAMGEDAEIGFVRDLLATAQETPDVITAMTAAWTAGSEDQLETWVVDAMRDHRPRMYDILIRRRNLAWTEALEAELKGSGVDLVNVGAGHLLGEDGLPALLRGKGYKVERVQ